MTPTHERRCPVCGTAVRMKFPDEWPSAEDVQIRYAQALFSAAGENYEAGRLAAGLAYNTFRKLVRAQVRHRRPLTRGESGWILRPATSTTELEAVGPAGLCGGQWAEVGSGSHVAYDLALIPAVDGFAPYSEVPANERPTVTLFEADNDAPRVFAFGTPCGVPSVAVFVGVGSARAICVVFARDLLLDPSHS